MERSCKEESNDSNIQMFRDNWNVGHASHAGAFAGFTGASSAPTGRVAGAARSGASSNAAGVAVGIGNAAGAC
jgi:hypothetical protein